MQFKYKFYELIGLNKKRLQVVLPVFLTFVHFILELRYSLHKEFCNSKQYKTEHEN